MPKFANSLDLQKNELQSVRIHNLASDPSSPVHGQIYFNTTDKRLKVYDSAATAWRYCSGPFTTADISSSAAIELSKLATSTSSQLATLISDETGSGALVFANTPTLVTPILGTPQSVDLTNATNLPIGSGISGLGTNVATFLATPSSANLASAVTDETGSGALVFGTSPSITTGITTASASFALVNTTATTVSFAGAATTLSIGAGSGTTTINNDTVVGGNLTVNGTTTTVNSVTVTVDDKNLELGSIASPTDAGADGGGITLKGATDKTWSWFDATDAWTSSEHIDLAAGKSYKIAGTDVLSGTTLGAGVTSSSLTSAGTITSATWNASAIGVLYGGTGATTAGGAKTNLGFMTRYVTSIGNGAATSYTVTHTLGTLDVIVQVYLVSTGEEILTDVTRATIDTVTVSFSAAPTTNQYRVVVIG